MPIQLSGINVYDVREKCNPDLPLCYNFTLITDYLNQASVKQALGVNGRNWNQCNRAVDLIMAYAGDWTLDFNGVCVCVCVCVCGKELEERRKRGEETVEEMVEEMAEEWKKMARNRKRR